MKSVVLITMILAIIAPVFANQTRLRTYECYSCGVQRQNDVMPHPSDGGACIDKFTKKKRISHTWKRLN
jgi:hypothetical protein